MDRWEIEKKIALHCIKNPKFKDKLRTNPKEALRELFGNVKGFNGSLLENVRFVVHEEKKGEFHIAIPNVSTTHALSDEELERVSGGAGALFPDCWGTA